MAQQTILPDDPRLTAYALGEMEAAEREEFEKQLQHDAAARQTVAEIRSTVATLTRALAEEPLANPASSPVKAAIAPARDPRRLDGGLVPLDRVLGKKISFPQFYYLVGSLAAACFAVFFAYWDKNRPTHEVKKYIEVPLTGARNPVPAGSIAMDLPVPELETDQAKSKVEEEASVRSEMRQRGDLSIGGNVGHGSELFDVSASAILRKGNTEAYAFHRDSDFQKVADNPLSTFSADVDTASYANVRRFIMAGKRPPVDAVRIEELVNYFPYSYTAPGAGAEKEMGLAGGKPRAPFAAQLEVASAPWAPEHRLVRIGLKGREVSDAARPAANLVFLIDVSGSMNEPNKLPLVKQSLRLLVDKLRPDDHVAIVVYAGASGLALPSTAASHKTEILEEIDRLEAGGTTNGALGIQLAYDIAKANFVQGGVNRVILATDGDFNVGVSSEGELVRLIEEKAKSGVFLSVLGFGTGNVKDTTMEQLADKGNGNYAYIDTLAEARKTLVEQVGGTLVTIAKDVKLQVEFNPALVQAYRLIGYENRLLAKEDFNNDKVDAGEIGSGHTVTALYEIVPMGEKMKETPGVDSLKYQATKAVAVGDERVPVSKELLTVKIRYKEPAGDVSSNLEFPLFDRGAQFAEASSDFKFASAVAAFGMVLRDSPNKGSTTLVEVEAWGRAGLGNDVGGYRNEFLGLVGRSKTLL